MRREGTHRISPRQLAALELTGGAFPVFRVCASVSWPWALAGGLLAAGTTALLSRARKGAGVVSRLLAPGFALLALWAAWEGTWAYPETAGNLLAAALILLLGLTAARLGPAVAARCAGVLLWITGALYGVVLIFSLPQARLAWLRPAGSPRDLLRVWALLAAPGLAARGLAGSLPPGETPPAWPGLVLALLAAAVSGVCAAILSPALSGEAGAFLTLARSVSVLGVIRRFEALVSGALVMSAFSLCALFAAAAAEGVKNRGVLASKK